MQGRIPAIHFSPPPPHQPHSLRESVLGKTPPVCQAMLPSLSLSKPGIGALFLLFPNGSVSKPSYGLKIRRHMSNLINYLQHTDALINAADEYKPSNLIPFHTFQKL